jgi:hypothetical protein
MSSTRHRGARPAPAMRVRRLVVPAAVAAVVTGLAVAVGLTNATGKGTDLHVAADSAAMKINLSSPTDRSRGVSRSAPRVKLQPAAVARKYATAELNLWSAPTDKSKQAGLVKDGTRIAVTGQVVNGWAEVLLGGVVRYVNADYLSATKPADLASTAGVSGAPCPDGSSTEHGLTSGAIRMFRAVCAAFPALVHYGGWDAHGEHSSGRAVDFMIDGSSALGQALADWLRAHAAELNLYDVIWAQHIYTQERGGEGWRAMPNRGSATANHYDHVHASVY